MIKKMLVILAVIAIVSCERNDLCIDPGTPGVVTVFYNGISQQRQAVDSLVVLSQNGDTVIAPVRTDSLVIPLPVQGNEIKMIFQYQHGNLRNPDTIRFGFTPELQFISKACGFKTVYTDFNAALVPDNDNWIQSVQPVQTRIDNDSIKHLAIYY